MSSESPLVIINAVGLTRAMLPWMPTVSTYAGSQWVRSVEDVLPAVTCTAQATFLTGALPSEHGIVGNGWFFRDTGEVRFWQQSNTLIQREPLYVTAKRRAAQRRREFRVAKLFWWFNQGADVDISATPKPYYAADGNKAFGISGTPEGFTDRLERELGPFPFHSFWGPRAGLPCTEWIARCAARVIQWEHPDLALVYLPHLDYDPQRFGPSGCDLEKLARELDRACSEILDAARAAGARVWIWSEYGHCDVVRAVEPNRLLRNAGLLTVRPGPFGEILDLFASRAFAVCDHQIAHIYVRHGDDIPRVNDVLGAAPGLDRIVSGEERQSLGLDHARSGELIALAKPDAWFAYPYWLDNCAAPDYARTVDIHRKPGYDPCELFVDRVLRFPKLRIASKLLRKKLGFRTLFDVVPLDPSIVRGSHGLRAKDPAHGPLLIGDGPAPASDPFPMNGIRDHVLAALGLPD